MTGNSWEIDVHSVSTEVSEWDGYDHVIVNCSITNISDYPGDFSYEIQLDDNGVLISGYSDYYMGKQISPGATVDTELKFNVDRSHLSNVQNMKLVLDGEELSLQYF